MARKQHAECMKTLRIHCTSCLATVVLTGASLLTMCVRM